MESIRLFKHLSHLLKPPSKQQGFTLIEILITSVIIGILAALSFPVYMAMVDDSKYANAKTQMKCTANELQSFRLENGYFPADQSRNIAPVGISCFYTLSSGKIPFPENNAVYDYDSWTASSGYCYIQIIFLGKNGTKDSPTHTVLYPTPGFYQGDYKDDLILSLGVNKQNEPC